MPSTRESLVRGKVLLERYADVPADCADVTLVALGEELNARVVFTLDRRGFSAYRTDKGKAFEIRP